MQKYSYHTHTDFSDGKNTIEEMLAKAVEIGYEQIGITDHLVINEYLAINEMFQSNPKYKNHKMYWDSFVGAKEKLASRVEQIRKVAKNYPIKVFVGFEVDYFSYLGWEDKFRETIADLDLDYLHIGSHYGFDSVKETVVNISDIVLYSEDDAVRNRIIRDYFSNLERAVRSGMFVFVAHINYISISGICATEDYVESYKKIFETMRDNNVAVEVNTKSSENVRRTALFYPNAQILALARDLDVKVLISDDCHDINKMAFNYDKAEDLLKELNYSNRWKFD